MDQEVDAAILAGVGEDEIEDLILVNILGEPDGEDIIEMNNFNFENLSNSQCKSNFRFEKEDIRRLVDLLRIPDEIRTSNRNRVSGSTALCVILRRLSYPNRLKNLQLRFGFPVQSLSHIINFMSSHIIDTWGQLLNDLESHVWLNRNKMAYYAQAITDNGGAVGNCWAVIDGTVRPTWLTKKIIILDIKEYIVLSSNQFSDGIIISLLGAYPGRRHDAGIFQESGIYNQLERVAVFENNQKYVLYGDQAYGIRELLLRSYARRPDNLQQHEMDFNNSMKVLRTSVEWGFEKVVSQFVFIDFGKNLKLLLQDVESLYKIAALFSNCHTCLYGSETSDFFNTQPPTLEQYLNI